jgi:hypothetical protein
MSTYAPAAPSSRAHRSPSRRRALTAGILYLITIVASLPAVALYRPVLDHADFALGTAGTAGVRFAAVLEVVLALACVSTAVVLYPIARRQSESAAVGFVASRILEAGLIVLGVISVLAAVTLRDTATGPSTDAAALVTAGHVLAAVHTWAFLLGPGLLPAVNAVCLGSVMYRSGLVPRIIPAIGLLGAPLLAASAIATLFGVLDQVSALAGLAALPVAAWELALGLWLTVKGFRPSPLLLDLDIHPRQGPVQPSGGMMEGGGDHRNDADDDTAGDAGGLAITV